MIDRPQQRFSFPDSLRVIIRWVFEGVSNSRLQFRVAGYMSFFGWSGCVESNGDTDWRRYRPCETTRSADSTGNDVSYSTFRAHPHNSWVKTIRKRRGLRSSDCSASRGHQILTKRHHQKPESTGGSDMSASAAGRSVTPSLAMRTISNLPMRSPS